MQNINNTLRDPFVLLNAAQSLLFSGGAFKCSPKSPVFWRCIWGVSPQIA